MTAIAIDAAPPFASGGKVRGGIPIRRSNGDNVLATLKTGEVVLNEKQQSMLGGDATFKAIGVPGFATGGIVTPSNIANVQNIIIDDKFISDAVQPGDEAGTMAGSRFGQGGGKQKEKVDQNDGRT